MSRNTLKQVTRIVVVILLAGISAVLLAQVPKGALEPEDANEARLNRLQPPDKVMDIMELKAGMVAAEIGAGKGRYVMQMADRVGNVGRIYAEDIDKEALEHLERRCARWRIENVETILGEVTDPKLPQGRLDRIFVISSYHHFADPVALMRNARAALKPTGMLVIAEWMPDPAEKDSEFNTSDKMAAQMKAAGYDLDRIDTSLNENRLNVYLFRPAGGPPAP